jgi:hypothetical protein
MRVSSGCGSVLAAGVSTKTARRSSRENACLPNLGQLCSRRPNVDHRGGGLRQQDPVGVLSLSGHQTVLAQVFQSCFYQRLCRVNEAQWVCFQFMRHAQRILTVYVKSIYTRQEKTHRSGFSLSQQSITWCGAFCEYRTLPSN